MLQDFQMLCILTMMNSVILVYLLLRAMITDFFEMRLNARRRRIENHFHKYHGCGQ